MHIYVCRCIHAVCYPNFCKLSLVVCLSPPQSGNSFLVDYLGPLLTGDGLCKHGPVDCFSCALCLNSEENSQHLFLLCPFSLVACEPIRHVLSPRPLPDSVSALRGSMEGVECPEESSFNHWDSSVIAITWLVWHEQNACV